MPLDSLTELIGSLSELKRMYQLNVELLETLAVTCDWIKKSGVKIPNEEAFTLLCKTTALIYEIQADEPKILQYKTHLTRVNMNPKTDAKLTEPIIAILK